MRSLIFEGVGRVTVATVADPTILAPSDAVVAVKATAICGSDLHVYRGHETGLDLGTVLGHEFAGEVVAVGSSVRRFRPGDAVVSPFSTRCGECYFCRIDLPARCERGELFGWVERGQGLHGAQAELVRVPFADATLVPTPAGLAPEIALLAGDVLSTGFFGASQAEAREERTIAVVGCGPVGLMAVIGARELGAERVFAIDALPERLALATRFGAEAIVLGEATVDAIRAATAGYGADGADGVVEAVGSPAAMRLAYELVRTGGTIAAVGVHNEPIFALTPAEAYAKNLTYRTGRCSARFWMERLLPLAASGRYDLAALYSHRLGLADGVRAYELFDRRLEGCTKVALFG